MKNLLLFASILFCTHISTAQKIVNYNIDFCNVAPGKITLNQLASGQQVLKIKHPSGAEGKIIGFDMIIITKASKQAFIASSNTEHSSAVMKNSLLYLRVGDSFIITNIHADFGRGTKYISTEYTFTAE